MKRFWQAIGWPWVVSGRKYRRTLDRLVEESLLGLDLRRQIALFEMATAGKIAPESEFHTEVEQLDVLMRAYCVHRDTNAGIIRHQVQYVGHIGDVAYFKTCDHKIEDPKLTALPLMVLMP